MSLTIWHYAMLYLFDCISHILPANVRLVVWTLENIKQIYLVKLTSIVHFQFHSHTMPYHSMMHPIIATSAMNTITREFWGSATEPWMVQECFVNLLGMQLRRKNMRSDEVYSSLISFVASAVFSIVYSDDPENSCRRGRNVMIVWISTMTMKWGILGLL